MADSHTAPPVGDSVHQQPGSGSRGVAHQPEPPHTAQTRANKHVGVYDRPERTLASWSLMTLFALVFGVLLLLWFFGIFDYILR